MQTTSCSSSCGLINIGLSLGVCKGFSFTSKKLLRDSRFATHFTVLLQAAVGYEYQGKTEAHASQKGDIYSA